MPKWLNLGLYFAAALFIHDIVAIYGSAYIVHSIRIDWFTTLDIGPIIVMIAITVLSLYIMNVYQFHRRRSATQMAIRTFLAVCVAGLIMLAILYVTQSTDSTSVFWRGNLPFTMLLFAMWASLIRYVSTIVYDRSVWKPKWLVVGGENEIQSIQEDYKLSLAPGRMEQMPVSELNQILEKKDYDAGKFSSTGIILASQKSLSPIAINQLMRTRLAGTQVVGIADFYEQYLLKVPVQQLEDTWFIFSGGFSLVHHDISLKIKRIIDITIAAVGLTILFPLMILVGLTVAITSHGPVFYTQERYGQIRKRFCLRKFRTMVVDAEAGGAQWSQPNDPRVTTVGKFLRASRLDELPQLWNVLVGDMSFIGPRPERPDFVKQLEQEIPYFDLRHLVKPGISGWAQVMYPYGRSVDDALKKLEFDLYYIKNYSLTLDIYIFFRTIRTVLARSGI